MNKRLSFPRLLLVGSALAGVSSLPSCASDDYGSLAATRLIQVEFDAPSDPGSRAKLRAFPGSASETFNLHINVLTQAGDIDTSFNGYVRLNVKPGTVVSVTGEGASGRNALVTAGVSPKLKVEIAGSFGETNILAQDLGYTPADPTRNPPPECADGLDNDGDGVVDFPADVGCAYPNDDTETGGTYAQGASPTIFYALPRVADVRGVSQGGGATAFPSQQVKIDCGWDELKSKFRDSKNLPARVIVTRIAPDGFYVTDLDDPRGYNGVFAFNFNAPANMRICDRLKSFGGTASDFYGFTEINYPTWTLEEWDQKQGECLVPEPTLLVPAAIGSFPAGGGAFTPNKPSLLNVTAGLVRVAAETFTTIDDDNLEVKNTLDVHIAKHFGPDPVTKKGSAYVPSDNASNCDFSGDGKVDFNDKEEGACSDACDSDAECSEYNDYLSQSAFMMVVSDGTAVAKIQGDGSQSTGFNALPLRGTKIRSFTGTLRYFSGGTQFTIEARCSDDIVLDLKGSPVPSTKACVHARTEEQLQSE